MIIKIQKKIGNAVISVEVEGRDEKEVLAKALFYTQPDVCGLCKYNSVIWTTNKVRADDGGVYTYIKRRCLKCKAVSTAGEYKDGGLFWKPWEPSPQAVVQERPEEPTIKLDVDSTKS